MIVVVELQFGQMPVWTKRRSCLQRFICVFLSHPYVLMSFFTRFWSVNTGSQHVRRFNISLTSIRAALTRYAPSAVQRRCGWKPKLGGWGRCFSFSVGCWYFCRWTSLFSFGGVCTFPPLLITYILLCSWVSLPSKTYHMMAGLPCGFFKMSPLKASFTTTFSCVPFKRRAMRTLPIALPWHFSHKWKSWEAPNLRSFEVVEIYFWKRFVVEICES